MRFEYVLDFAILSRQSIRFDMDYLKTASKNRYKTREGYIRRDVRKWMDQLSMVLRSMVRTDAVSLPLPLLVRVDGEFKDHRSMPDLHNFVAPIADSIEHALEINDRYYRVETGLPEIGPVPKIIITLTSTKKRGKKNIS